MSLLQDNQWQNRYVAPSPMIWKGRKDSGDHAYFHQVVQTIDLTQEVLNHQEAACGIVGFCSDEGVRRNHGRPGAAKGPKCLRESLGKLPIISDAHLSLVDCGDVNCTDSNLESSQQVLGKIVHEMFQHNIHPIIFGGGHEIAWGTYQGIASAYPEANIGIINFDAHYDLRPLVEGNKGSSGTPFYQVAKDRSAKNMDFNYLCIGIQRYGNSRQLFDRARELNVTTIYADDIFGQGVDVYKDTIRTFIAKSDVIYLSICMDVFEAAVCPGVSAPQVLGLHPWHVIPLMREIVNSSKTICLEIAELSPFHDINMRSAKLGASIVCDYIHHKHQI
jgi:formiminoglutamase